jgi:hypothetical protein
MIVAEGEDQLLEALPASSGAASTPACLLSTTDETLGNLPVAKRPATTRPNAATYKPACPSILEILSDSIGRANLLELL